MSKYENSKVKICHKKGKVIKENVDSYTVSLELSGVIQHIVVTKDFVKNNIIEE